MSQTIRTIHKGGQEGRTPGLGGENMDDTTLR